MTRKHALIIKSFSLITMALLSNNLKKISDEKSFGSYAVCFAWETFLHTLCMVSLGASDIMDNFTESLKN